MYDHFPFITAYDSNNTSVNAAQMLDTYVISNFLLLYQKIYRSRSTNVYD